MGKLTNAYIDPENKWILIREGIDDKGNKISTSLAIPQTNGDRIDIISNDFISDGYQMDLDIIVIIIKNGNIRIDFNK
jgi:hypothetical protein